MVIYLVYTIHSIYSLIFHLIIRNFQHPFPSPSFICLPVFFSSHLTPNQMKMKSQSSFESNEFGLCVLSLVGSNTRFTETVVKVYNCSFEQLFSWMCPLFNLHTSDIAFRWVKRKEPYWLLTSLIGPWFVIFGFNESLLKIFN